MVVWPLWREAGGAVSETVLLLRLRRQLSQAVHRARRPHIDFDVVEFSELSI